MSIVRLSNVTKSYDGNLVLREVYLRLDAGDRVGLIGRNGSGKTTVLRLILGQEEPTQGIVDLNVGLRIGYFSQFSELNDQATVEDVLDGLLTRVHALQAELAEAERAISATPGGNALDHALQRQSRLFDEMERQGGWTYRNKIDTVLTRLGFSPAHRRGPIWQASL